MALKKNFFNLSNYKLMTALQGYLYPCNLTEVLPGDTFRMSTSALVRVAPLARPVMHPVHVTIHHWFVPHRLVWDDWEDFITGGPDGEDDSVFPLITAPPATGVIVGTLPDYYGISPAAPNFEYSALALRGYAKIWNEWYRDQDLQTPLVVDTGSGPDTTTNTILQRRAWEKDYFTTSRLTPQKGPAVTLPLGTTAPVLTNNLPVQWAHPGQITGERTMDAVGGAGVPINSLFLNGASVGGTTAGGIEFGSESGLYASLADASAATVNSIRLAMALQRFAENRSRYGSRYAEFLKMWGVRSSDARLQRPEYLGGGKRTISFSEVLQTAPAFIPSDDEQVGEVGDLKGHGIGAVRSNSFQRFFEEHGYVHSFISVMPKTMYVQGVNRTHNRRTKEDFFNHELQHIGQQEVLNKEIYAMHSSPNGVFGYQDRYDEYRRQESSVAGSFRDVGGQANWHMARIFGAEPALNASFIASDPTNRIYANTLADQLQMMVNHKILAKRIISKVGNSFIY